MTGSEQRGGGGWVGGGGLGRSLPGEVTGCCWITPLHPSPSLVHLPALTLPSFDHPPTLTDVDFNPQIDRQAEDRCHRLGQTRPVMVRC